MSYGPDSDASGSGLPALVILYVALALFACVATIAVLTLTGGDLR